MSDTGTADIVHSVRADFGGAARLDSERYAREHQRSIEDPEGFWGEVGRRLEWVRPFSRVRNAAPLPEDFRIRWYEDGTLNVAYNCLDRHVAAHGDRIAIFWEGDAGECRMITYRELCAEVNRCANVLKSMGVGRGDCVALYLAMIPEAVVAILACARIGAVHSVVSADASPDSLASQISDCASRVVITADEGLRDGKKFPLKGRLDTVLARHPEQVDTVIVVSRTGADVARSPIRDFRYEELISSAEPWCAPEEMRAEDPLFMLYTAGAPGKPTGVLHSSGGYLAHASYAFEAIFDRRPDDVFWCTADIGSFTGHSYVVYGPLSCAATTVMYEGVPAYTDPDRLWEICDKYRVTTLYAAPVAESDVHCSWRPSEIHRYLLSNVSGRIFHRRCRAL